MKRTFLVFGLVGVLISGVASMAVAHDRTVVLSDTTTLAEGTFELAGGFGYFSYTDAGGISGFDVTETRIAFLLWYGISEKLQLEANIPIGSWDVRGDFKNLLERLGLSTGERGLGDVVLRGKYRFVDENDTTPAIAGSFGIKLATGDEDKALGTGETDFALLVALSKALGGASGHLNLGYTIVGEPTGEDYDNEFHYGIGLSYPTSDRLSVIGELAGKTHRDPDFDDPLGITGSIRYAASDVTNLVGFLGFGLTDGSPDYSLGAWIEYEF